MGAPSCSVRDPQLRFERALYAADPVARGATACPTSRVVAYSSDGAREGPRRRQARQGSREELARPDHRRSPRPKPFTVQRRASNTGRDGVRSEGLRSAARTNTRPSPSTSSRPPWPSSLTVKPGWHGAPRPCRRAASKPTGHACRGVLRVRAGRATTVRGPVGCAP